MSSFIGLVTLGNQLDAVVATYDSTKTLRNATSLPTYRVYGPAGIMAGGSGSVALKESGSVSTASNATPIKITTTTSHNLTTGTRVTISGVTGNVNANVTATITVVDSTSFTLDSSTGGVGAGTGGTWNSTGLYDFAYTPTSGNGFASGVVYSVVVYARLSTGNTAEVLYFQVT